MKSLIVVKPAAGNFSRRKERKKSILNIKVT